MQKKALLALDESQRVRHARYLESLMPTLIDRLYWTRDQIDEHRKCALRSQLKLAKASSPWHSPRLAQVDPDHFELRDLCSLPTMNKQSLMANWDEIVTVPGATLAQAESALQAFTDQGYIWRDHILLASGGTGGRPGVFVYDWHAFAESFGGIARAMAIALARRFGERRNIQAAAIGAEASAHGSYSFARIFSNPENPILRLSSWRRADEVVTELNSFQPESLSCYATYILPLIEAARSGELRIDPKIIFLHSEGVSAGSLELARATWPDADILTCWSTSEGVGTFPCLLEDGFHVCEDLVIIEPVDPDGNPVPPGETSAGIYLTNLTNKALPILRYHIEDMFEMDPEPCQCGSAYQKVRRVHGRSFEVFRYGEVTINPLKIEFAILTHARIVEYQIRQTETGVHVVFGSEGEIDCIRLRDQILEAFRDCGLAHADVRLEGISGPIARTSAGKLRRFVPLER